MGVPPMEPPLIARREEPHFYLAVSVTPIELYSGRRQAEYHRLGGREGWETEVLCSSNKGGSQ